MGRKDVRPRARFLRVATAVGRGGGRFPKKTRFLWATDFKENGPSGKMKNAGIAKGRKRCAEVEESHTSGEMGRVSQQKRERGGTGHLRRGQRGGGISTLQ